MEPIYSEPLNQSKSSCGAEERKAVTLLYGIIHRPCRQTADGRRRAGYTLPCCRSCLAAGAVRRRLLGHDLLDPVAVVGDDGVDSRLLQLAALLASVGSDAHGDAVVEQGASGVALPRTSPLPKAEALTASV